MSGRVYSFIKLTNKIIDCPELQDFSETAEPGPCVIIGRIWSHLLSRQMKECWEEDDISYGQIVNNK